MRLKHPFILGFVILGAAAAHWGGYGLGRVVVAALAGWVILRLGVLMLGGMARPIPEPPPAGELRKVKIAYRCEICGTEVRMTVSPDTEPDPPRHCQEDMTLMTPVEDL